MPEPTNPPRPPRAKRPAKKAAAKKAAGNLRALPKQAEDKPLGPPRPTDAQLLRQRDQLIRIRQGSEQEVKRHQENIRDCTDQLLFITGRLVDRGLDPQQPAPPETESAAPPEAVGDQPEESVDTP